MSNLTKVKSVKRIIVLDKANGAVTLYRDKGDKKKKQSMLLKPLEKGQRRWARAMMAGSQSYLDRHESSNRKKRDGWLRDLSKNARRAMRRGAKKLSPSNT